MRPADWIEDLAARAIDPARVRGVATHLAALWPPSLPPLEEVVAGLDPATFAHLLSVSPISGEKLLSDPAALAWLAQPAIWQHERGPRRMRADYRALLAESGPSVFDGTFRILRRCKAREMLRIALREVSGAASIEQTTLELTHLAELCMQTVCADWLAELTRKYGPPASELAVLGLGKLGGQELNYSSDIDVMFLSGSAESPGPPASRHFLTQLAEKIVATFSATDPTGPLFRIDLRLRPEGDSGALVRSLDSLENYYAASGETWERMALIKARVVAGSAGAEELGYEVTQRLQAFVYPRTVSHEVVDEIRAIKERIEREIVGLEDLHRNVKLGYGGIREIEFIAQTLQVLHGAKNAFLQERNTLRALRNLEQLDFIPNEDVAELIAAYRFLRTVEHRLQIENEAQTHLLPEDPAVFARLARSLGFQSAAEFRETLGTHTRRVRAAFDEVLGPSPPAKAAADLSFFQDPAHARHALEDLGGVGGAARFSPRTRNLFALLEPLLLDGLRRVAEPDTALTGFVRFVERYGARGLLFETLVVNPRVLELLVRLFDASRFMTDIVLRRPQLLEEIARTPTLGESRTVAAYLAALGENEEGLAPAEWVRAFRRSQVLRLGLRDILGFATLRQLHAEYTALAEACLLFVHRQLGLADAVTVVAMGKFGGREVSYGADLDVIFIGGNVKAAAELMRAMSESTAEGIVFPMDARLRPEGAAGQLCTSLAGYEAYFEKRAQLWEAQALTKARAISGPQQGEFMELAPRIWRRFGTRDDLFEAVAAMHGRIVKERGGSDDFLDFKTGTGGLIQLEFFTQAHQLRSGCWEQNTADALDALAKSGVLPAAAAATLNGHYFLLRRVEAVLRRVDDQSVSRLPADAAGQRAAAIRCGFESTESFLAACSGAREGIRMAASLRERA